MENHFLAFLSFWIKHFFIANWLLISIPMQYQNEKLIHLVRYPSFSIALFCVRYPAWRIYTHLLLEIWCFLWDRPFYRTKRKSSSSKIPRKMYEHGKKYKISLDSVWKEVINGDVFICYYNIFSRHGFIKERSLFASLVPKNGFI